MKTIHFLLFFFIISPFANAYHLVISGIAKGLSTQEIHLSSSAWIEEQVVLLNAEGKFAFVVDYQYPAMFTLRYGAGREMLKTDVFVMNDLNVEAELVSAPDGERVFLRVPDRRSAAFKSAKNYAENLYVDKNYDNYVIDKVVPDIKKIPNIQEDEFTEVYAKSEKLNFLQVMMNNYGKMLMKSPFEMEDFASLPKNHEYFMGIEAYRDLMVAYNELLIKKEMEKRGMNRYDFYECVSIIDSMGVVLPEQVQFDLTKNVVNRFVYNRLPDMKQKELYLKKVKQIVNNYPGSACAEVLRPKLMEALGSIENKPAPDFALKDDDGTTIRLQDFQQNFILIDVWGSWCRPCRVKNPKIVEMYNMCKDYQINISFVGVAQEQDKQAWRDAIDADGLVWTQVLADVDFIANYQIKEFPTMILIDNKGTIKKISPTITMDDIINIVLLNQN